MLRLRPLQVHYPTSWEEAAHLLRDHAGARLMAGGTDLLPSLKLQHEEASVLISLARLQEPTTIEVSPQQVRIAAHTPLDEIAAHPLLPPALAQAAGLVASPPIRHRATLGGNLCLQPRCRYLNQSPFHRQALGGCLKAPLQEQSVCHVVPGGTQCVAALSADTVPVLIALEAVLDLVGSDGPRSLRLADFYTGNGRQPFQLHPAEVLRSVTFAPPPPLCRLVYRKWRPRHSIDFPMVSLALRLDVEAAVVRGGTLVVGALGPRPRMFPLAALAGKALDAGLADSVVEIARSCHPLANLPYDATYRKDRLLVEIRRAVEGL